MHIALVVDREPPAEILDEAVHALRSSGGTLSVVALCQPVLVVSSMGWMAPTVVTGVTRCSATDAANLARSVVDRLPADVPATHSACLGWQCPRLLARLQSGDFDLVLLAGWPVNPLARRALLRAARAGCSLVSGPPRRGALLWPRGRRAPRPRVSRAHEVVGSA
jgi:hypothetical protein